MTKYLATSEASEDTRGSEDVKRGPSSPENLVLSIEGLRIVFPSGDGVAPAVDGLDMTLHEGERVGLVGESGSGKTMTALGILGLVPYPGTIAEGSINIYREGQPVGNTVELEESDLRSVRGSLVGLVFQDSMTSLDPLMTVGSQVDEAIRIHGKMGRSQRNARVRELFESVGLNSTDELQSQYPHQLSGGMRQRVAIAMAIASDPRALVADEPTTALDVTVQMQILDLLVEVSERRGMALLLISHNIAAVLRICSRVVVMYAGQVVESLPRDGILRSSQHPYTWLLLRATPRVDPDISMPLYNISGSLPDMADPPTGCRFHPRCPFKISRCESEPPPLMDLCENHLVRCWVRMENVSVDQRAAIN